MIRGKNFSKSIVLGFYRNKCLKETISFWDIESSIWFKSTIFNIIKVLDITIVVMNKDKSFNVLPLTVILGRIRGEWYLNSRMANVGTDNL